jgi:hypothetical protein
MHSMNRFIWLSLFIVFAPSPVSAQHAFKFAHSPEDSIRLAQLEAVYIAPWVGDSAFAPMDSLDEKFRAAWVQVLQKFGNDFKQSGITWGEPTRIFLRIYFNESGGIDEMGYSVKRELTPEVLELVDATFQQSVKEVQFGLSPRRKFVQCGSVSFADPKVK